jgi:hypothetical protein
MTVQTQPRRRVGISLSTLAWLNVGLHVAGLVLAAAFLEQGSPLVPMPDRRDYLAGKPIGWIWAWAVWALCALTMVAFTAAVSKAVGGRLARQALMVAVAAAAIDLTCDGLFVLLLPDLANAPRVSDDKFLVAQGLINFFSLAIANGLYSVSTLLLSLGLRRFFDQSMFTLGFVVFAFGIMLAVGSIADSGATIFFATPLTIGLYCLWVPVVVRGLRIAGVAT